MTQLIKTQEQIAQKAREEYAEMLPITEMLSRGYFGCLAPRNFPAVDSFIFKLDEHANIIKTARIQSKYTCSTKGSGIPLEKLGFDFLVIVRDSIKGSGTANRAKTQIYVVPVREVEKVWGGQLLMFSKLSTKFLYGTEKKTDVWQTIINFLEDK